MPFDTSKKKIPLSELVVVGSIGTAPRAQRLVPKSKARPLRLQT